MAYTDAIGSACKMLGMGADVYWSEDRTKYTANNEVKPETKKETKATELPISEQQIKVLVANSDNETVKKALEYYKKEINQLTIVEASTIIKKLVLRKEVKENE